MNLLWVLRTEYHQCTKDYRYNAAQYNTISQPGARDQGWTSFTLGCDIMRCHKIWPRVIFSINECNIWPVQYNNCCLCFCADRYYFWRTTPAMNSLLRFWEGRPLGKLTWALVIISRQISFTWWTHWMIRKCTVTLHIIPQSWTKSSVLRRNRTRWQYTSNYYMK